MKKILIFGFLFVGFLIASSAAIKLEGFQNSLSQHSVPATKGTLSMNFILNAQGVTQDGLVEYTVVNNTGTLVIRGETYTTVAYYTQVMGPQGNPLVRWFDLFGVSNTNDNLAIVYIGCNPPPNTDLVVIVWEEDFFHLMESDSPSTAAFCDFTDLSGQPNFVFPVTLPALIGLPTRSVDTKVIINGSLVYLNGAYGWMMIKSQNYSIIPINTVDCSDCGQNCDSCPTSPWYELHFIYYSDKSVQTGFGIFYIYPYDTTFVQLNYTLCLPTLAQPAITFKANWTGNPFGTTSSPRWTDDFESKSVKKSGSSKFRMN